MQKSAQKPNFHSGEFWGIFFVDWYLRCGLFRLEIGLLTKMSSFIISHVHFYWPINICIQVYYAIFYSYLNIGCNVWGFTSEKNTKDIQTLQNKCVRIMTFAPFNSNTDQAFIDLKLLKVSEVIKTNQLKV